MHTIHTYLLTNTMIMMISLYSQSKENVTSFETLKLFTQYILHQHLYSIYPSVDVPMDFCAMSIYIYIYFFFVSRETKEKKNMVVHLYIQNWSFSRCLSASYIQRSIFAGDGIQEREREMEVYVLITLSSCPTYIWSTISAMSVWSDGIHLCPNNETTI